jgi:hypothetical protein
MLALPAFAACRSELSEAPTGEASPAGVAIEFTNRQASNGMARSAGDLTTDNLTEMTVYAHYTAAADFADVATTSAPNFMMNQSVTKDGSGWTYSPVKYWPAQGEKVSFFAITTAPGTGGVAAVGSPYTGYPSFTITPPATPAQQPDICVASAPNRTKDDGMVPLHFAHAMAKVAFAAQYKGATLAPGQYVKIKLLRLAQVAGSGTLTLTGAGFTWDVGYDESSLTSYHLSVENGDLADSTLPTEGDGSSLISTEAGTLLPVPQAVPAGTRIQLIATFYNGTTEKEYEITAMLPADTWEAGKQKTYNLVIDMSKGYMELEVPENIEENINQWSFSYTGAAKTFTVPKDGYYLLEAWGTQGGNNSNFKDADGGYCKGSIYLKAGQSLYVYVGQKGYYSASVNTTLTWNGGGNIPSGGSSTGGGATDFRLILASTDSTVWNDATSLNSRIMVAGSGGGHHGSNEHGNPPGAAGGLFGYNSKTSTSRGGTQTGGGYSNGANSSTSGGFGYGGYSGVQNYCGGGGSGYYGGAGNGYGDGDGSGGSSFISGMKGCVAINLADITNDPRTQDTTGITTALNYSAALLGASDTWSDGDEILFTNISMVDGEGYEWNTGAKAGSATGMPNPAGGTMTGNTGNGYARITLLQAN